jgi:hypothetical protein
MRRRQFITLLGGAAAAWPLAAHAQQPAMPVVGYLNLASPESDASSRLIGLRRGLNQTGYVEGRNFVIEYRWAGNQLDRLPALAADLVQLQVSVIVAAGLLPAQRRDDRLSENPNNPVFELTTRDVLAAAPVIGVKVQTLKAGTDREIDAAFASLVQAQTGALLVGGDVFVNNRIERLIELAARHAIPTMYLYREFVVAGGSSVTE